MSIKNDRNQSFAAIIWDTYLSIHSIHDVCTGRDSLKSSIFGTIDRTLACLLGGGGDKINTQFFINVQNIFEGHN